jgi:hypothetical protein
MNNQPTNSNTDTALQKALMLRDVLAREINTLNQDLEGKRREIVEINLFIESWKKFSNIKIDKDLGVLQTQPFVDNLLGSIKSVQEPRKRKNSKKEEVARATRQLIEQNERPMTREELYPLLVNQGLVIEGSDKLMVLSTMLWRMMNEGAPIVRLRGGGYWLKERGLDNPPYRPDQTVSVLVGSGNPVTLPPQGMDTTAPDIFWNEDLDKDESS